VAKLEGLQGVFLLNSYDIMCFSGQKNSSSKIMKVNPVTEWENYEKVLRLLFTKVSELKEMD